MNHGTRPNKVDHRDYDYHKSFGTIGIPTPPQFPPEYLTDANLWMPNQDAPEPIFNNPALPFGCTDYTQADLASDEVGRLKNPMDLETLTHANADGGEDIRTSLDTAQKFGWFGAYFAIKAYAPMDYFDAIRLAISSGYPEKRSVSLGTPWWEIWEGTPTTGIVATPLNFAIDGLPWHNHKVCGWKTINGVPYLISKSWQGANFGDKGLCYFDRALVNQLMAIPGTVAFTATQTIPPVIQTIDMNVVRWLLSLVGYRY